MLAVFCDTFTIIICSFLPPPVRDLSTELYLGTLTDSLPGRVMCLACGHNSLGNMTIVTGGTELKVWTQVTDSRKEAGR